MTKYVPVAFTVGALAGLLTSCGSSTADGTRPSSQAGFEEPGAIKFSVALDYPAATLTSGGSAGAIAAADFNRDGLVDLVIANTAGGGPSILLGVGGGAFAAPYVERTGIDASTVESGDFNNDGIADVLAASYATSAVAVLLGDGAGRFTQSGSFPLGGPPTQLAVADFDRDGNDDVAAASYFGGTIALLLGNGNGTFRAGARIQGANIGLALLAADLNQDGIPDLVTVETLPAQLPASLLAGEALVLFGDGDGAFRPPVTYGVGILPEYIGAGDINEDGHSDLVIANALSNDVSLLMGLGDGRFAPEQRFRAGPPGSLDVFDIHGDADPGLQLADFNRDGHLDLAVIQTVSSRVALFEGDGRGHFVPAGAYDTAGFPEPFIASDLNGDGCLDLAVPGNTPPVGPADVLTTRVSILLNVSDGCF